MKNDMPTPLVWGLLVVAVLVAGLLLWRAGNAGVQTGTGRPTAQDHENLKKMQELRQKAASQGKAQP